MAKSKIDDCLENKQTLENGYMNICSETSNGYTKGHIYIFNSSSLEWNDAYA